MAPAREDEQPYFDEACAPATIGYLDSIGKLDEVLRQVAACQIATQTDLLNVELTPEMTDRLRAYTVGK